MPRWIKILSALKQAAQKESFLGYRGYDCNANSRNYRCKILGCINNAYAKKLCNAHYLRLRDGRDLNTPILNRQRGGHCIECKEKTSINGGWGRCAYHYKVRRYRLIKQILVRMFGGICADCKQKFPDYVFDFHHRNEKKKKFDLSIGGMSLQKIAEEVCKCLLLCANCHRERTHGGF